MANPHRGEVEISAAGKVYNLRFSANALCDLEEALGMGVSEIAASMGSGMRVSVARAVFWCALRDNHPEVDERAAGHVMSDLGIVKAIEAVSKAFGLAFPNEESGDPRPPRPGNLANGIGSGS